MSGKMGANCSAGSGARGNQGPGEICMGQKRKVRALSRPSLDPPGTCASINSRLGGDLKRLGEPPLRLIGTRQKGLNPLQHGFGSRQKGLHLKRLHVDNLIRI